MKRLCGGALCVLLLVAVWAHAAENWPGKNWDRIDDPSVAGYSRAGLDRAVAIARGLKTSAFMVVVGGGVLLDYGDTSQLSYVASVRKSILSMLYGIYVDNGTIRIDRTLADLGINDVGGLMDIERTATIENLLGARSGVFHPASYPGDALAFAPPRGSQKPGTYYLYATGTSTPSERFSSRRRIATFTTPCRPTSPSRSRCRTSNAGGRRKRGGTRSRFTRRIRS